jgi:hypothetical protein
MPRLFEIADEIEQLMAEVIDPETGEITDEGLAKLDALEMERDEKAIQIALYRFQILLEAEGTQAHVDRLAARVKILNNQAARLKQNIQSNVPRGHKINDPRVKIGWLPSTSVEIVDDKALPADCLRQPEPVPIKETIKRRIKLGEEVPGAKLVTRHHVWIR